MRCAIRLVTCLAVVALAPAPFRAHGDGATRVALTCRYPVAIPSDNPLAACATARSFALNGKANADWCFVVACPAARCAVMQSFFLSRCNVAAQFVSTESLAIPDLEGLVFSNAPTVDPRKYFHPCNWARFFILHAVDTLNGSLVVVDDDVVAVRDASFLFALKHSAAASIDNRLVSQNVLNRSAVCKAFSMLASRSCPFAGVSRGIGGGLLYLRSADVSASRIRSRLAALLDVQRRETERGRPAFLLGSLVPLNFALHDALVPLPETAVVMNLGFDPIVNIGSLSNASFLHWNGVHKPWLASGLHRELWWSAAHIHRWLTCTDRSSPACRLLPQ